MEKLCFRALEHLSRFASGRLKCFTLSPNPTQRIYSHCKPNASGKQIKFQQSLIISSRSKDPNKVFCSSNVHPNVLLQPNVRHFRTSRPNAAIHPFVILVVGRVGKAAAMLVGRNIRKWWATLPAEQKAVYAERARKNWKYIYGGMGALSFGLYVYYDSHLQETPYTKRKRFVAFSPEQFDELSRREFEGLVTTFRPLILPASMANPAYRRVSKVANHLLKSNSDLAQIKKREWTISVVGEDAIHNAFVLPCGNIFVFTGMLHACETDDELGVILAHEMAHAVLGHGAENASYAHLMDLVMILPIAILWAILPTDWTSIFATLVGTALQNVLFGLPYSRAMEIEADEVGLFLAAKACFDIRFAPLFWEKMAIMTGEGEPYIEWLSTHPSHESRQIRLKEVMPNALALREDCQCPRLPLLDHERRLHEFKKRVDRSKYENVAIRLKV